MRTWVWVHQWIIMIISNFRNNQNGGTIMTKMRQLVWLYQCIGCFYKYAIKPMGFMAYQPLLVI